MVKISPNLYASQVAASTSGTDVPQPFEGDALLPNFQLASGEVLPELRMHYRTLGTPTCDVHGVVRNAVLITHGTGGTGDQFLRPEFAGVLFGPGCLLDAELYYLILTDGIGHGKSSKPSDGLRAGFPSYGYRDMVDAQHRLLLEGLGINHLRLVMGISMGGQQAWTWGVRYSGFMDALMPLGSVPSQISGLNRVWRRIIIDAIRNDPGWHGGNYSVQPQSLRTAWQMFYIMCSNPVLRQQQGPTQALADQALDAFVARGLESLDANDLLYQMEASRDYDPNPDLEKIQAPLFAVNSADDLINPHQLGILEREIGRVRNGRAVVLETTRATRGHGSYSFATLWKHHLELLLAESANP